MMSNRPIANVQGELHVNRSEETCLTTLLLHLSVLIGAATYTLSLACF
jgi:hypothetical protein